MSRSGGRGGEYKRNRHGDRRSHAGPNEGRQNKADQPIVDESSPVIQAFLEHQKALDSRHDKYERLVKLSRDVTIESKRTIFLLHRITGHESSRDEILKEAEEKLAEIEETRWKTVAGELLNEDPYQFLRAYSPGLQEYIEAVSFYHYLLTQTLISLPLVEEKLHFTVQPKVDSEETTSSANQKGEVSSPDTDKAQLSKNGDRNAEVPAVKVEVGVPLDTSASGDHPSVTTSVHVPPMEYILGIADLTGELMRMAITSVSNGNLEQPFALCSFIRVIHDAFVSFGNASRELPRKLFTLRQSLKKVETACYTLQVRGSEIPKHMLTEIFSAAGSDQDRVYDTDMSATMDD